VRSRGEQAGPHFLLTPRGAVHEVSSTAVRALAKAGKWDELTASGMLHRSVCAFLLQKRWLRPVVVGISGASRSGKSTLSSALAEQLAAGGLRVAVQCQDRYFDHGAISSSAARLDEFDGLGNWETPDAIDHARFTADALACARDGNTATPGLVKLFLEDASCPGTELASQYFTTHQSPHSSLLTTRYSLLTAHCS